jgi:hypothetical protein
MSVLNSWNGGFISDGKIIKINIDGKQYDLVVKDEFVYKDGTGYEHVTMTGSVSLHFHVSSGGLLVKFLSWPTIDNKPVAGKYVKMTSIGGREVECSNTSRV